MHNQQHFQQRGPPNAQQFNTGMPGRQTMGPGGPHGPGGPMMGGPRQTMGPPNYGPMGGMGQRPNMMSPGQFQTNSGPMPPPHMMNSNMGGREESPEPAKPQKIKVELSNKERGYYSNLISKLETDNSSRIDGKQAVAFFKTSGVDVNTLKSIWRI